MLLIRLVLERQSGCEPGERDVGLGAAEAFERGFGGVSVAGHASSVNPAIARHIARADELAGVPLAVEAALAEAAVSLAQG